MRGVGEAAVLGSWRRTAARVKGVLRHSDVNMLLHFHVENFTESLQEQ